MEQTIRMVDVEGIRVFLHLLDDRDTGYLTALLVRLLLVGLSGSAAAIHSTTRSAVLRGATSVLAALAAPGALLTGAVLVT